MSLVLDFPLEICRKPLPNEQNFPSAGTQHAMEFMALKNTLEQPSNESTSNTAQQMENQTTPTNKGVRKKSMIYPTNIKNHTYMYTYKFHTFNDFCQTSPQKKCGFPPYHSKNPSFSLEILGALGTHLAGCVRCFVSCDEHCESPRP